MSPVGIEPTSSVLQTAAMTTFAKATYLVADEGFEPTTAAYETAEIPFL